jgi:hypothetical protein
MCLETYSDGGTIRATLNSTGRKLLKADHGKLTATATATYSAGTASDTATATITLHAAKNTRRSSRNPDLATCLAGSGATRSRREKQRLRAAQTTPEETLSGLERFTFRPGPAVTA